MLTYLENLRKRPEPERRKVVLIISVSVTLVIALVWGVVMFMRISGTDFSFTDKAAPNMPSLSETFSNFATEFHNIMDNASTFENQATSSFVK